MIKSIIMALALSLNLYANSQLLVSSTSDEDKEVSKLYLVLDENKDITGLEKKKYVNDENVFNEYFAVEEGENKFVLKHSNGRDIVSLVSKEFSSHQGGNVTLVFLYNGIRGTVKKLELDLARDGDVWSLYHKGDKVSHLHMITNRAFILGAIGIKEIEVR